MATEKYVCNLDENLQEIARVELNEDPDKREKAIEKLRRWVKEEGLICGESCTDDLTLLKILRHSKFRKERSRKRFVTHFRSRASIPEWYSDRDPLNPTLLEIIRMGFVVPLKYDSKGRRIIINRIGHFDPSVHSVKDIMKVATIVGDFFLSDEKTQINGAIGVIDFNEFGPRHAMVFTPAIRNAVRLMQECVPGRTKACYFYNTPALFPPLYSICRLFLTKKLKERFFVLGNTEESLHEVIDPEFLPTEYGGTAGSLQSFIDLTEQDILKYRDRLLYDDDFVILKNKPEWENNSTLPGANLMF